MYMYEAIHCPHAHQAIAYVPARLVCAHIYSVKIANIHRVYSKCNYGAVFVMSHAGRLREFTVGKDRISSSDEIFGGSATSEWALSLGRLWDVFFGMPPDCF